ncbi:MAG TPA: Ig-like domain-containing protein [Kofleriaceae bacterium]|nr:Ig-like domain-containing protein [Kofleriaceae bacterium]
MKLLAALGLAFSLTLGASLVSAGQASAEPRERATIFVDPSHAIAPPEPGVAFVPPSRILYIDWCDGGCQIVGTRGGDEDSRTNKSSIVSGTHTVSAFSGGASTRAQILQCVRTAYARFNIQVVDQDPGNVPHWEDVAAGIPSQVGFGSGVAGVSPYTCGVIPNAITYSFLNLDPGNVLDNCWTIAQESAHAFGLAHEFDGRDYMTYNPQPAAKSFVDQTLCIGTQGCCSPSQECQCGPTTQNSYQKILSVFGVSNPTPPTIAITNPHNDQAVRAGFPIAVTATDNDGVANVRLELDGVAYATLNSMPYVGNGPATIADGPHTLKAIATDTLGSDASAQITFTVGSGCQGDGDCAAAGQGYVCVDGRCVPGETATGGLGTTCTGGADCASGQCASKDGDQLCTEVCDPTADGCPGGYSCLSNGAGGGLCWPSEANCLGCSTNKNDPTMPIGFGLVVAGLVVRRRRRK